MEIKRILLSLLLLSLVNIGLMVVLLYRSSTWTGTYHALINYAIKKLQYLDYRANTTDTEQVLNSKENSLEMITKNDGENLQLTPNPSLSYESDREADVLDDHNNIIMRVADHDDKVMVKSDRYVQVIKVQSKRPLNRFRKTLQNFRPFQRSSASKHVQALHELGDSMSMESVIIQVENSSRSFTISKSFTFPHFKNILRDNSVMAKTPWIIELAKIMSNINQKTIFAITVNQGYKDTLLNWLISAIFKGGLSLDRILVISLDQSIQEFLQGHGITCIYIPVKSLFNSLISHYWIVEYGLVMFTRISVVRLLNHWGYSVVIIDTDALVLHDPQPLFDQYPSSSIVASSGTQPRTLFDVWNTTACNGLILLRSNPEMELFWQKVGKINLYLPTYKIKSSDQLLFNYALDELGVVWQKYGEYDDAHFEGECSVNGMQVTTVSQNQVCRFNCRKEIMDSVYVWHPRSKPQGHYKMESAEEFDLVFLSEKWTERRECDGAVGEEWLLCISDGRFS